MNYESLAAEAVQRAARLRVEHDVPPSSALCPVDLAQKMNISVRLVEVPSLEGLYTPDPKPTIVLSSQRPPGRRRFTCAHEIGHHVFGDGICVDEVVVASEEGNGWNPTEYIAHRFAVALLMPKRAVDAAFTRRGWSASTTSPYEVYVVAHDLGVGYSNLVRYLERTLKYISTATAAALRRIRLPDLRASIAGVPVRHDLIVADQHWGRRPIDLEVDDLAVVPDAALVDATNVDVVSSQPRYMRARRQGVGRIVVTRGQPPTCVRVSRRGFSGLAQFRHLEEPNDEK